MFYISVLQSVLSFGLICVLGNMRKQDQDRLQRQIRTAGKIIGIDQETATSLYTKLILQKLEKILQDSTHPLHSKFSRSSTLARDFYKKNSKQGDTRTLLFLKLSACITCSFNQQVF